MKGYLFTILEGNEGVVFQRGALGWARMGRKSSRREGEPEAEMGSVGPSYRPGYACAQRLTAALRKTHSFGLGCCPLDPREVEMWARALSVGWLPCLPWGGQVSSPQAPAPASPGVLVGVLGQPHQVVHQHICAVPCAREKLLGAYLLQDG